MRLKKITLENIRSYKSEAVVFPEGSTLLSGDIGSGKTTILLSIAFALFGLQPGQRGSSLLASSEDEGRVILELDIKGLNLIIERKLKRSSKSVAQDYAAISIDGEKEEMSITELKAKILSLLNYPPEFLKKTNILYNYTVYSPQEQMKQIILEDPESRLNVLRHVFGIDKYKKIKENLLIVTAKLREDTRILQYEIRDLEESKTSLASEKEFLSLLSGKIEAKKSELEIRIRERKKAEQELHELTKKIEEKQNFEKEIEKTKIALTYKNQEKTRIDAEIKAVENRISNLPKFEEEEMNKVIFEMEKSGKSLDSLNRSSIEMSTKLSSLQLKQKEDLMKKERIFKIDICPTCLQDVPDSHKHNILNETENQLTAGKKQADELAEKILIISAEIKGGKISLLKLESRKRELEILKSRYEEISSSQEALSKLKKQTNELEKDCELLNSHVNTLKNSVLEYSKYSNLYKIKETELKILLEKERSSEIETAELKKEFELTQKEIVQFQGKIQQKEEAKQKLSRILEVEQWLSVKFSDLISFTERNMMARLRNEFSKFFNKWFSMLTTDAFYVNLDENFTPVVTQGDYELDYEFLSGGERTAVALSYRLALNQIINSLFSRINTSDLVILDEPTDGFSSQQLDKVRDILQELKIGQLIIVSHEPKIESFVENVVRIRKENGESKVAG